MADFVGVKRKCGFTTKCNFEKISVAKELLRSGRPRKLTSRDESCFFKNVRINPTKSNSYLASDFSSKLPNFSLQNGGGSVGILGCKF
ncbi:hypothetical protein BpHYR1_020955 [Brachionus plicatilis]|uniref:Uncharacterized protein n=1 Tax=Brachionus plicatilis TaxID=10195 RepID=A0A3M7RTL0_BRAPC|nr:hypothetical protein BpHYR1_020955 [Brachionus plicatilis]